MVARGAATDIDVLPNRDVAIGPEDRQSAIPEHPQPARRKPVDTCVTSATIATEHDVAEVLDLRKFGMVDVSGLSRHHARLSRGREEKKLVDAVRCKIAQDSTGSLTFEEPGRPRFCVQPVWCQCGCLHDATDDSCTNQLPRTRHARTFMTPNQYRKYSLRLSLHTTNLIELLEAGRARIVNHEVLAVLHDGNAEGCSLVRDCRTDDKLNRLVLENFPFVARRHGRRIPIAEGSREVGLLRKERYQLSTAADDGINLCVDVI